MERARAMNRKIGPVDLFKNENGCLMSRFKRVGIQQMNPCGFYVCGYDVYFNRFLHYDIIKLFFLMKFLNPALINLVTSFTWLLCCHYSVNTNQSIIQSIINQDILFPLVTQQKTAVIAVSCHQT